MGVIKTIEQIERDFENSNPPFDTVEFPEERLLREMSEKLGDVEPTSLSMERKLRFISAFATFDYNRNASQLVDNLVELRQQTSGRVFEPFGYNDDEDWLQEHFEDVGMRYPNRDAHGWWENNQTLRENYSGKWHELILDTGCCATSLVERLRDESFLYLQGKKIAPMYARIINDHVCPLDNMWELDIPSDVHIIRLTGNLADAEMDADDTRNWWRNIGQNVDISRHVVDGALWQIGNNWDEWGEGYWDQVTDQ